MSDAKHIRHEFLPGVSTPRLDEASARLREAFTHVLNEVDRLVPPGRERALVATKLQEALHWGVRGIYTGDPVHGEDGK